MLKVHFVAGTRAGRVIWLLEELGLEYEVNIMPFTKEGLKSPEHRARHALGRVPVLEDGEVSIFESGAPDSKIDTSPSSNTGTLPSACLALCSGDFSPSFVKGMILTSYSKPNSSNNQITRPALVPATK